MKLPLGSRKTMLLLVIGCIQFVAFPIHAWAATIKFMALGESLRGARITDSNTLLGFVGDFIELKDGKHNIAVAAPKGYSLHVMARVDGHDIEIYHPSVSAPNCQEQLSVEWPTPTISPGKEAYRVITVSLNDPRFGATTGRSECYLPSVAACTTQKVVATINSDPVGAEIWIDGELQPYRTNATLSVPYCDYQKTKDILLRFPNAVNCQQHIALAPDAKVVITCALAEVGR